MNTRSLGLLIIVTVMLMAGLVYPYEIIGNSVIYSNEWGSIKQTPHTLTDISQDIEIEVTSNISVTQNLDFYFGFDTSVINPTKAWYWAENVAHTVPTYGPIPNLVTVSCGGSSAGIINTTSVWCFYNSTNVTYYCPTPRFFPDAKTCQYNETITGQNGTRINYYADWVDASDLFGSLNYEGKTYYYVKNIAFAQNQTRKLKANVFVKPNEAGKYDLLVKRSSDSEQAAFIDKTVPAVILDPWYNSTWASKRMISINSTANETVYHFPIPVVVSGTNLDLGKTCLGARFVDSTESTVLSYELENNTCLTGGTTGAVYWVKIPTLTNKATNTTIYMYYRNSTTVGNGNNSLDVWSNNYTSVYHGGEAGYLWDSVLNNHLTIQAGNCYVPLSQTTTAKFGNSIDGSGAGASRVCNYTKASPTGMPSTNGAFSVTGWYRVTDATTGGIITLTEFGTTSTQNAFSLTVRDSSTLRSTSNVYGAGALTDAYTNSVDTWYFASAMHTGGGNTHYIQSNMRGAKSGTLTTNLGTTGMTVGGSRESWSGSDMQLEGQYDELRFAIVNRTPAYVQAEYGAIINIYGEENSSAPTVMNAYNSTIVNGTAHTVPAVFYKNTGDLYASGNCSTNLIDVLSGNFTFYKNGAAQATYTTSNWINNNTNYSTNGIGGTTYAKGENWLVGLKCYYGTTVSTESNSSTITVNNTAPTITAPTLNNTSPAPTATILCTVNGYADADGDGAGTAFYRWWKNGAVQGGQTASTLSLPAISAVAGDKINCSTKNEDSGYDLKNSTEVFSAQATVGGAPTITAVELTKQPACSSLGTPVYAGIVLTCKATPSDPDSAVLNVTYAFYRNGTSYSSTTVNNLPANVSYCSYNEISVSDTVIKKSDTWLCSARAFDGLYYSDWANSTGATINNTAPRIGTPTINNTSPITSSILLCNNGSYYDLDGDAAGTTYYQWYKNGVVISGNTSSTLNLTAVSAAYNDLINCSMIRSDSGYDLKNSTENFSTTVRVQSPPWTTSTTICEGAACGALSTIYVDTSLNCYAYIYDNDTATINEMRFNWRLNGSIDHTRYNYSVANASKQFQTGSLWANPVPNLYFAKGDTIYCESRAYDGLYYSSYLPSTYYTVNNTAPTITAPTLNNYNPTNTTTLTCTGALGYSDADGDTLSMTYYKWYKNGVNLSANTSTLNLGSVNASDGDIVYCENWVSDSGYDMRNSTHYNSSSATVGVITAPTITICPVGYNVLNFSVLDEQNFNPIYATMEATFTLYNITSGLELSNVSFFIENQVSFAYCINPYAAVTIVNSYQTYYPYTGTEYTRRNYYLFNSTLDATNPQQINIYLLNASASTDYTFQVVNQYLVPISGVKLSMYRFMPTLNAWVIIEQKVTDFSGYALFDLQAGTLYKLVAEASGYVTLNTDFTPGAVTSIQIRLQQDGGALNPLPNFEQVFGDVSYKVLPTEYFYNTSAFAELQISSTSSSLQNYSMKITRRYNGTTTIVYFVNVTTSPGGGILNYTASSPGEYTLQISFKHANYTNPYSPMPTKFFIGSSSGASFAKDLFATGFLNGWAYYFLAVVIAMLAAGFALRYSPEASGAVGLLILWGFTYLYPFGVIVTVGGVGITILYATILTTLMVLAVMFLKWWV